MPAPFELTPLQFMEAKEMAEHTKPIDLARMAVFYRDLYTRLEREHKEFLVELEPIARFMRSEGLRLENKFGLWRIRKNEEVQEG